MSLVSRLRLSDESSLDEGTPDEVIEKKRRALDERLRPARLEAARRNSKWTEIEDDLVARGRGYLVSAASDAVYRRTRGVVFAPYSVSVIADQAEFAFYVDRNGELVFLELEPGTWSEHVERQARRGRR